MERIVIPCFYEGTPGAHCSAGTGAGADLSGSPCCTSSEERACLASIEMEAKK